MHIRDRVIAARTTLFELLGSELRPDLQSARTALDELAHDVEMIFGRLASSVLPRVSGISKAIEEELDGYIRSAQMTSESVKKALEAAFGTETTYGQRRGAQSNHGNR